MIKQPVVSVVLPVYNAELFLADAIESILNQTFSDFEFIIVNDGSLDSSLDIIKRYALIDTRIKLVDRENRGLIITLNEALELAQGDYIARMDADDISLPTRFDKQVSYLSDNSNCVAVGVLANLIDSDDDLICSYNNLLSHEDIDGAHIKCQGGAIVHPSAMIRRRSMIDVNGYSKLYPHAEDLDLWLRLAEVGYLTNIPEKLFLYRQHVNSIGYAHRILQVESATRAVIDACQRRNINFETINPATRKAEAVTINEVYVKWGWWALNDKNIDTARKYAIKALLSYPFNLAVWKLLVCSMRGY